MSSEESRDQDLERLLRRALATGSAAGDACLDAETLAAWSDETLRADEAQRVETHVSTCGRCQALLAAMVRTEGVAGPVAPSHSGAGIAAVGEPERAQPEAPLWRRWRLAWLVPVAATATALAVWVSAPAPSVPEPSTPFSTAPDAAKSSTVDSDTATSNAGTGKTAASNTGLPDSAMPQAPRDPAAAGPASSAAAASPEAVPSPPAPAAEQRLTDAVGATGARERDSRNTLETRSQGFGAGPGAAERDAKAAADAAPLRKESVPSSPVPAAPPAPSPGAALAARAASVRRVIDVGMAAGNRWRLTVDGDGARAEFSEDGGRVWRPVVAGPADLGAIVAGATPGGRTGWFVGGRGTVMLTLDGTTFRRLPFPSSTDLESVQPVDERRATVSGHGERYATTDGGATWARVP